MTFNPHSLIAARLLISNPEATVDALFLGRRLAQAAALRDRLIGVPYYRLIHAEADGLPGVIVDRFGDALVVQVNTAGMDALTPVLLEALEAELSPKTIVLKNDSPVRELEGPEARGRGRQGRCGGTDRADRERRAASSPTCRGARRPAGSTTSATTAASWRAWRRTRSVLDVYCYSGGFGVLAAKQGAKSVALHRPLGSRRSMRRRQAATLNGVDKVVSFEKARPSRRWRSSAARWRASSTS